MPKIFTDENKDSLKTELLDMGFEMLKTGGLNAVNIDLLTKKAFIAKGTFYNLFESKSEYMYHMMIHERNRSKSQLNAHLDDSGKLSNEALRNYLIWLSHENPNVFSYLKDPEKKRLLNAWDERYIENEENDSETMHMLISLLATPKDDPDWKLACNYMKLIAVTLSMKNIFITDNYEDMILSLIDKIIECLCK